MLERSGGEDEESPSLLFIVPGDGVTSSLIPVWQLL